MKKSKSITTSPTAATISAEQLAGLCNLTKRRLYQLADENKIPQPVNGDFPMLATITALFGYYQRDGESLQREKMLKTSAERKLREHELANTEGKFLTRDAVARDASDAGARIRTVLIQRLTRDFPIRCEQDAPQELKVVARTAGTEIGGAACDELLEFLRRSLLAMGQPPIDPPKQVENPPL
jgi:hypothetical protein